MDTREPQIDYKTHILIGIRADGVMNVVEDWPHLPSQADVQDFNRWDAGAIRDVRALHADIDHAREAGD